MDDVFRLYREALEKGHQAAMGGQPREALSHYQEAARLADTRALPHVLIGGVLLRTGETKEAIAAYDRALERSPDDPAALSGKAAALLADGRGDEATALAGQVDELDRQADRKRREAADAAEMRQAELSGAISRPEVLYIAAEKALRAGREAAAVDAWLDSARAYAEEQHLDAALESGQRALLTMPGAPRVHLELARLYLLRGWNDKAGERMALLGRLMALQPDAEVEAALHGLAREHAAADPRLAALAADDHEAGSPAPA